MADEMELPSVVRVQVEPTKDQMKLLVRLVQLLMRAFYKPDRIVVMDKLLEYSTCKVKEDVIAECLGLNRKVVLQALYGLEGERMVRKEVRNEKNEVVNTQPEPQEEIGWNGKKKNFTRAKNFIYWYVDYRNLIHTLQYRLIMMEKALTHQPESTFLYRCENRSCGKVYQPTDSAVMRDDFKCEACSSNLISEKVVHRKRAGMEVLQPLRAQLKKVLESNIPLPSLDNYVTSMASSGGGEMHPVYSNRSRMMSSRGVGDSKLQHDIIVDLQPRHPACLGVAAGTDSGSSSRSGGRPPPWMNRPVDEEATANAVLIVKVPRVEEKQESDNNSALAWGVSGPYGYRVHLQEDYKEALRKQARYVVDR